MLRAHFSATCTSSQQVRHLNLQCFCHVCVLVHFILGQCEVEVFFATQASTKAMYIIQFGSHSQSVRASRSTSLYSMIDVLLMQMTRLQAPEHLIWYFAYGDNSKSIPWWCVPNLDVHFNCSLFDDHPRPRKPKYDRVLLQASLDAMVFFRVHTRY